MPSFFGPGSAQCPMYLRTRDSPDEPHVSGRAFLEQLWQDCGRFLDPDSRRRAMHGLPSVFWELYLAHALKSCVVRLVVQRRSKQRQRGPDLLAQRPEVWIEAVVPTPGTGPDALSTTKKSGATDVPIESFVMRLRAVIDTKAKLIAGYIRGGVINEHDAAVVAVSGMLLDTQFLEQQVPRIARALYGVSDLVIHLDRNTRKSLGCRLARRDEVIKQSGASVRTDIFLDPAYAHISAVLYSPADWINRPSTPGTDLILLHNPLANSPLPTKWLGIGQEYHFGSDALRRMSYTVTY